MSINAKSVKSIRKKDLSTQKTPFVAFKSFSFAHEATAGQTVISLTALSTPTSYAAQGFLQPSASDLAAANLLLYKRNLRLQSSLRGVLLEYDSYRIVGSSTIQLTFDAEEGEIFVGVISDMAKSGLQVIDANTLVATGSLAAGQTDFVVGQSFALNQYPLKQVGDVLVFLDGVQQFRNVGNATASVSADGNYEELDGGQGLSNTIRFNVSDPLNARSVLVVSNGTLAERPEGSLRAEIESLAGQVDSVIETLAVVAGVPETNFQSNPNQVDLQTFGQRVITLESNRARIDQSNTWTVAQKLIGRTDGTAIPANEIGEVKTWASAPVDQTLTTTETDWTNAFLTLPAGVWQIYVSAAAAVATGSGTNVDCSNIVTLTDSANTKIQDMARVLRVSWVSATAGSVGQYGVLQMSCIVTPSTSTVYKLRVQRNDGGAAGTATIFNTGPTLKSNLFAVRIG